MTEKNGAFNQEESSSVLNGIKAKDVQKANVPQYWWNNELATLRAAVLHICIRRYEYDTNTPAFVFEKNEYLDIHTSKSEYG